jgi:hypothetical protein
MLLAKKRKAIVHRSAVNPLHHAGGLRNRGMIVRRNIATEDWKALFKRRGILADAGANLLEVSASCR